MSVITSLKFYVCLLSCLVIVLPRFVMAGTVDQSQLLQVDIVGKQHGTLPFYVELADTSKTRGKGLMGRERVPTGQGMLFDFGRPRIVRMWMYKTLIPLDMLFIDAEGDICYIYKNAQPHDRKIISSPLQVRWVLEINGGVSDALHIMVGDKITSKEFDLLQKRK